MTDKHANQTGSKETNGFGWWIGITILFAVVSIILGTVEWFVGYQAPRPGNDRLSDLGNLGSYLQGTTGSIWALAGVFIIFVAFLAQKRQLHLQQQQFERQSFEASFFQLLNLFAQIPSQLRIAKPNFLANINPDKPTSPSFTIEGRGCFREWFTLLKGEVGVTEFVHSGFDIMPGTNGAERLKQVYSAFYTRNEGALGHYFRNLYHLVNFVKAGRIGAGEKMRYMNLVKAQLSAYELALHYYHSNSSSGEDFQPLVKEFGLLDNLDHSLLVDPSRGKTDACAT